MASIPSAFKWRTTAMVGATLLVLLMVGASLLACGGSEATTTTAGGATTTAGGATTTAAAGGDTVQVVMKNVSYDPESVTVKAGDTVTWTNEDAARHDVVADNGEFKSDLFGKGETFSFTFAKAGTYPYHCSVHSGMAGTVIAQ